MNRRRVRWVVAFLFPLWLSPGLMSAPRADWPSWDDPSNRSLEIGLHFRVEAGPSSWSGSAALEVSGSRGEEMPAGFPFDVGRDRDREEEVDIVTSVRRWMALARAARRLVLMLYDHWREQPAEDGR
jgi:hypothetical protein